jgi:hypothetical protein
LSARHFRSLFLALASLLFLAPASLLFLALASLLFLALASLLFLALALLARTHLLADALAHGPVLLPGAGAEVRELVLEPDLEVEGAHGVVLRQEQVQRDGGVLSRGG